MTATALRAEGATETSGLSSGRPIPILFIIDELCELGGAERVLLRMVKQLPRDRFQPRILTFDIDPRLGIERTVSCPLDVIPLRRTYDWNGLMVARQIRRIVRTHAIQITHTFHETSDVWAGMIAKLSGCPILVSSRRDMGFQRQKKHRWAYRALAGRFDEVHAVSEQVRQFCIREDRLEPARVITLYNGVTLPSPSSIPNRAVVRRRFGLPENGPLVLSVGHIRAVKGFDCVVDAAARVCKALPGAVFAIAGDVHEPECARALRARVAALGIDSQFIFLGPVEDIPTLLYAADVFCLLSTTEGMSNALIEAMACELPCIATNVGGNPEVVADGASGYLIERGDAQSAAAHIVRLLQDAPLSRSLGVAGRKAVEERFTTQAMVRNIVASYERLINSHASRT